MRISHVKRLLAVLSLSVLNACGGRPEQAPMPERISLPLFGIASEGMPRALWFTSSNYTSGGKLGRVDLRTGTINRSVLPVGADTQIFPDEGRGLILLTRMGQDAVTLLSGAEARVNVHFKLPNMSNPQAALRDSKGRIWISAQNSDEMVVLSPDLKAQVASIDLSVLKAPTSLHADLAQMTLLDPERLVVSAQRLDRASGTWRPNAKSALATINTETLQVEGHAEVAVVNPIQISARTGSILLAGAGDLSSDIGAPGRLATLEARTFSEKTLLDFPAKILAADLSAGDGRAALIAWYAGESKSCVQVGEQRLICDGTPANRGYVFSGIKRIGNVVFASYIGTARAELWVLTIDGSLAPQKVPMDMPVQSLSFGP